MPIPFPSVDGVGFFLLGKGSNTMARKMKKRLGRPPGSKNKNKKTTKRKMRRKAV